MIEIILTALLGLFYSPSVKAEPWVANRFAQNCSSCHSPNRYNVPLTQRRCTLSCQGCHVNPSGGGMRNRYGVWNQNRWLRSSYWPSFVGDYKMPAVSKMQLYENQNKPKKHKPQSAKVAKNDEEEVYVGKDGKKHKRKKKNKKEKATEVTKAFEPVEVESPSYNEKDAVLTGLPLVTTDNLTYKEEAYRDHEDWRELPDHNGFMERVTKNDPLREEVNMHVQAGGDLRYFMLNRSGDGASATYKGKWIDFLMAADFDMRIRPTKRYLSFVVETEYLGNPTYPGIENNFIHTDNKIFAKSAYVLIDEIPFNTWAMGGYYRPMYGHYTPDHTALAQVTSKFSQYSQYKAMSVGTAPNVPFLFVHKVSPHDNPAADPNLLKNNDALVVNLGGRFVTLGLSGMLSVWRGTFNNGAGRLANNMTDLTFGGFFKDFVVNFDILRVEREFAPGSKDGGVVYTMENKYRYWRENYLVFNYAYSNVNPDTLKDGEGTQTMVGLKSFLYSGLELEVLYVMDTRTTNTGTTSTELDYNTIQGQVHMFF